MHIIANMCITYGIFVDFAFQNDYHICVQSRLSYATLQGTLMKRSYMTGGLLIQSPQNNL